jgi:GNAT superfamily N-acetyltransferase
VVDRTGANAPRRLTLVEITVVDGPLDERKLGWVADLYGAVDPKYRRPEYLEHLLLRGPAGPALHSFALADDVPVGHAAVVPMSARLGARPFRAGKLEALVVAEAYRGRRGGPVPVARTLLERLYERADAKGIELIHAYVLPPVGRAIGFTPLTDVAAPSLVALLRPRPTGRQAAERALSWFQRAIRRAAGAGERLLGSGPPDTDVRRAAERDTDLLTTPPLSNGSWAIVADDSLEWYASAASVRVLELGGAHGSRGLVQLPDSPHEPLRVAAWHSKTEGLRAAMHFLLAAARLAEATGAASLRVQQPRPDRNLSRAARGLGFVARDDLTTLWVRTQDSSLATPGAVVPTSMLYLGF